MSHLGRWLSALVDGELYEAERDRVLNHLAGCEPCRLEANALRALKRRMTALGDTSASSAITGRLIEIARSDEDLLARRPHLSSAAQHAFPATGSALGMRQARPGWMLAAGTAGMALAAIGAAAFMLGGVQSAPAPRITPAVDTYWPQHDYDIGQAPAATSGAARRTASPFAGHTADPFAGHTGSP